jgi:hypothetical protein
MAVCEVCGNDYDKSFEVTAGGATHTFDSFECAIHLMAPICEPAGARWWATVPRSTAGSSAVRTARDTLRRVLQSLIAPDRSVQKGIEDRRWRLSGQSSRLLRRD